MKFQANLTASENIATLLSAATSPSDIHTLEQTIAHRHNEMSFEQAKLLKAACLEKREELAK